MKPGEIYLRYDDFGEKAMLVINGTGVITNDDNEGWLSPYSASQVSMLGDLRLEVRCADKAFFEFNAIQFSGNIQLDVQPGSTIVFTSCSFDENTKFSITGGHGEIRLAACFLAKNATVDCSLFEFVSPLEVIESEGEDGAGFVVTEESKAAIDWSVPAGLGLLGLAVVVASKMTKNKKKKVKRSEVQHARK